MFARAGPQVDNVIGSPNGGLIMLDDQYRVAQIAQADQRLDKLLVIALVQADAGFVEDIEDAHQL